MTDALKPAGDMNVFAKNVGSILVNLPLLTQQARHEDIRGTLYYINPKDASGGDKGMEEAWEFILDMFAMKNEPLLKKWYAWHPSATNSN